jgi:hypothetical protein
VDVPQTVVLIPNDIRIRRRQSWCCPHKPTLPQRLHRRMAPAGIPVQDRAVSGMRGLGASLSVTLRRPHQPSFHNAPWSLPPERSSAPFLAAGCAG